MDATGTYNGSESSAGIGLYVNTPVSNLTFDTVIYPDLTPPTLTDVSSKDLAYSNGWATKRKFTLSGEENFCSNVTIKVTDSTGKSINNGTATVTDGKWSYTFTPNIEVKGLGTYNVTMSDNLGNSAVSTFTTSDIDGVAPTITSKTSTSTEWSTYKDVTFTCTDKGSGNVSLSLDDGEYENMYESDTSYSLPHRFTGDVYGSETHTLLYKDYTENMTSSSVTVYNIDNTAPTITDLSTSIGVGSSSIIVNANDINEVLGKSGSGVSEYGLSNSKDEQPTSWQSSNILNTTEMGTQYVWVKDLVGNISSPKSINISIYSRTYFDVQGGECDVEYQDYLYTSSYNNNLPIATRQGWVFDGWYTQPNGEGSRVNNTLLVPCEAEVTVYANWLVGTTDILVDCNIDQSTVVYEKGRPNYIVKIQGTDVSGVNNTYLKVVSWNKDELGNNKSLLVKVKSGIYTVSVVNENGYSNPESQEVDVSKGNTETIIFNKEEKDYSKYTGNDISVKCLK